MIYDYVKETASAPGTSTTFNLGGATAPFVTFASVIANGATSFYFMLDATQAEWGIGTLTHGSPNTLSRTTVIGNTAGTTAKLNFAGTTTVYCAIPSGYALNLDASGNLVLTGKVTATNVGQGALVSKSADQTISTSTYTYLTWATENYDDAAIWDAGAPTRLTVPSGFTRVRASFSVSWGIEVGFDISIIKNQTTAAGEVRMIDTSFVGCGTTPIMAVTAGDYFEVKVYQSSGVSQDVVATEFTWFALELLR